MGREIMRVAVDFEWPLNKTWSGYLMPDDLWSIPCATCQGTGSSARARQLFDLWYGKVPFRPEDNGSLAFTSATMAVRVLAERNVARSPQWYGPGSTALAREAERLANLFNASWSHHLDADDVAALVDAGRLRDFTHRRVDGQLVQIEPPAMPTPGQVNEWSVQGFGHDSINAWVCVSARCTREGAVITCADCNGEGGTWRDDAHQKAHDDWARQEPPEGDGWQLWETVSEGSPISPVFPTSDGLIDWMTTPAAKWGAMGPWSKETATRFVLGTGWAPTFVATESTGVIDGVTAVTR